LESGYSINKNWKGNGRNGKRKVGNGKSPLSCHTMVTMVSDSAQAKQVTSPQLEKEENIA